MSLELDAISANPPSFAMDTNHRGGHKGCQAPAIRQSWPVARLGTSEEPIETVEAVIEAPTTTG